MGLFGNILEKLGLKKKEETKSAAPAAKSAAPAKGTGAPKASVAGAGMRQMPGKENSSVEFAPKAISEVDVVAQLEARAKGKDLNWKVSIVDLLKLLDIDSSREAREELAKELNCPADQMSDSARMNVWLHKEVLRQIAVNGGNIPKDLLD